MKKCLYRFFLIIIVFKSEAQPKIISFAPLSGPVGTIVTITGSNFSSNHTENIVHFGLARGQVLSSTSTSIQAIVPINATSHLLTVTTNSKTVSSTHPFFITYIGNGKPLTKETYSKEIKLPLHRRLNGHPYLNYFVNFSMAVADFDEDGKIDIVSLGSDGDSLFISRNVTTNGNFQFDSSFTSTVLMINDILLSADFNADGFADLLCYRNEDTSLYIVPNKSTSGQISFGLPIKIVKYKLGYSNQFCVDDLDQDGLIDLTFFDLELATVFLYKNTSLSGNVSFAPKQKIFEYQNPGYGIANYGYGVSSSDLNNDGKKDLVLFLAPYQLPPLGDYHGETIILQNKGTTGSVQFEKAFTIPFVNPRTPSEVFIADVNKDGYNDILETIDLDFYALGIYLNNSTQHTINFDTQYREYYGYSNHIRTKPLPVTYDLNGDTKPDIVFTTQYHDYDSLACYIHLYENKSINTTLTLGSEVEMTKNAVRFISVADLNNDSRPEIFYIRHQYGNTTDTLIILEQQPNITTPVREQTVDNFLFSFYPNPAANQITVQLPSTQKAATISLTNKLGQIIKKVQFKRNDVTVQFVDLSDIPPGIYILTWSDGKNTKTQPLVVQ